MKDLIREKFKNYGFNLSEEQVSLFNVFYQFLIQENEKFNLTAITDPKEVVIKHFIDSVLPEKELKQNARVIDVGTGAGFPGVPLKILRPDLKITLLDSLLKRVNFLKELISKLNLKDITAVHARAENFVAKNREKFDFALSRAVASIPTLAEYLIPYVKVGGKVFMYKGEKIKEELEIGSHAISELGGKKEAVLDFLLSEVESKRYILVIKKFHPTNKKYPRGKNLPKAKPIV